MNTRARILVEGKVQGVGYRDFVDRVATSLGLTGQVQNLPDKTVEIICEGPEEAVKKFLDLVKVDKYPIKVSGVKTEYSKPTGEFTSFNVIWEDDIQKAIFERMGLASVYLQELGGKIDGVGNEVRSVGSGVNSLGGKIDGVGTEIKALRVETNGNFDRMDTKYDRIAQNLTEIMKSQETLNEKLIGELRKDREELVKPS